MTVFSGFEEKTVPTQGLSADSSAQMCVIWPISR